MGVSETTESKLQVNMAAKHPHWKNPAWLKIIKILMAAMNHNITMSALTPPTSPRGSKGWEEFMHFAVLWDQLFR